MVERALPGVWTHSAGLSPWPGRVDSRVRPHRMTPPSEAVMRGPSLIVLVSLFAGCAGSVRVVRQDLRGGVLALQGSENEARDIATRQMVEHCGAQRYNVILEEEVPVG